MCFAALLLSQQGGHGATLSMSEGHRWYEVTGTAAAPRAIISVSLDLICFEIPTETITSPGFLHDARPKSFFLPLLYEL